MCRTIARIFTCSHIYIYTISRCLGNVVAPKSPTKPRCHHTPTMRLHPDSPCSDCLYSEREHAVGKALYAVQDLYPAARDDPWSPQPSALLAAEATYSRGMREARQQFSLRTMMGNARFRGGVWGVGSLRRRTRRHSLLSTEVTPENMVLDDDTCTECGSLDEDTGTECGSLYEEADEPPPQEEEEEEEEEENEIEEDGDKEKKIEEVDENLPRTPSAMWLPTEDERVIPAGAEPAWMLSEPEVPETDDWELAE
nr:hypothetical protein CFP56_53225 [Quercus suber]